MAGRFYRSTLDRGRPCAPSREPARPATDGRPMPDRTAAYASASVGWPASGSGPKRFGPGVPRKHAHTIRTIDPISGRNANSNHQPERSISCSRRTPTASPGRSRPQRQQRRQNTLVSEQATHESGDDRGQEVKQSEPPIFRPGCATGEHGILLQHLGDRWREDPSSPPEIILYQNDNDRRRCQRRDERASCDGGRLAQDSG